MRVQDVIKSKGSDVITVREDASIMDATRTMQMHRIGALVVVETDGRLKGILSERDVVAALARSGARALDKQVRDIAVFSCNEVAPADSINDAMKIMNARRVRHLPVVLDSAVVGLISIGDVMKARLFEKIAENAVLQDIARAPRWAMA